MYYDEIDYKCIVCGEKIPTLFKKRRKRGHHYFGDYEVSIEYYDTSEDNYFVRLDNPEILQNHYKTLTERIIAEEREKLKKEIEENISKVEYRKLVESQLSEEIDKNFKPDKRGLNYFFNWFSMPLSEGLPQPRYTVNTPCKDSVLKNAKELEKQKYVVDLGKEEILRFKVSLDSDKFSKTFPFVSNSLELAWIDSIKPKQDLFFEFGHFSEFPLK